MVSVVPDAPPPLCHAIHRSREPYRGAHEPTRKRRLVVRFDEQVHVVGLHGKVNDPKPRSSGASDGAPEIVEDELLAQAR
jgi:hypothetical protein